MPAGSDPGAGTHPGDGSGEGLPRTFRPWGVRIAAVGLYLALVAFVAAIWFAFPQEIRDEFTTFQKVTVLGMGLMLFLMGHALFRCRVTATDGGLTVVNGYRTHRYAWGQVVGVTLGPGDPWAVLDLSDGNTRSALGIQGSDGRSARRQVQELRALIAARAGSSPHE